MKQQIRCIHCKADRYAKKGFRKTENRGKIQKYKCLSCHKYFTNDDGFYRMRTKPSIITMSIDMYVSNLSSRKMRNQLSRHLKTKRSHVTILAWVRKYVLRIQRFVETLKPKLSGMIYADETEIDRGIRNDIFWCAVDKDTRFIPATLYSPNSQNRKDAAAFFRKLQQHRDIYMIQTDGRPQYKHAFRSVFRHTNLKRSEWSRIGLRQINFQKTHKHNVRIESVFSKIKDRTRDFRGFKALWSAPILMTGLIIQHNFIETHSGIRKVPCEVAGLKVDLGIDRWLGLIRFSSMNF